MMIMQIPGGWSSSLSNILLEDTQGSMAFTDGVSHWGYYREMVAGCKVALMMGVAWTVHSEQSSEVNIHRIGLSEGEFLERVEGTGDQNEIADFQATLLIDSGKRQVILEACPPRLGSAG